MELAVRRGQLLDQPVAVLLGTTIATTLLLPRGLFLVSGADIMTAFGWGTVGLWTAARGWRAGLCVLVVTPALQLSMALLNGAPFDSAGVANLCGRTVLAAMNDVVPLLVYLTARRTTRATIAESRRAGHLAARADDLRTLHDTALAALDGIAMIAPRSRVPTTERVALIADAAATEAAALEAADWSAGCGAAPTIVDLAAVPVADQEPEPVGAIAEVHQQVAGLLGDPVPGWVGGDPGQVRAAAVVLDHDQDVEAAQEHGVDVREVDCEDCVGLRGQELAPARPGPSGCGIQSSVLQDLMGRQASGCPVGLMPSPPRRRER